MRKNSTCRIVVVLVSCLLLNACEERWSKSALSPTPTPTPEHFRVFDGPTTCGFPATSPISRVRGLAGTWSFGRRPSGYDHDCGMPEKHLEWPLHGGEDNELTVTYGVTGDSEGALSVEYVYDVLAVDPVPPRDEEDFRKEFVTFLEEGFKQSFRSPLPPDVKSRLLDLQSFDTGRADVVDMGDGRLVVSRNRKNGQILITAEICADKGFEDCSTETKH